MGESRYEKAMRETEEILYRDPTKADERSLPINIVLAEDGIEDCRQKYQDGDNNAVMHALQYCAMYDVSIPDWLAREFLKGYRDVTQFRAGSWDEVFGPAHRKGAHLAKLRKRREVNLLVYSRVEHLREHESVPVDEALFERVGREHGVSKTVAADLYYSMRRRFAEIRQRFNRLPGK